MSITRSPDARALAGERTAHREAGGLRVLGTRALHLFGAFRYKQFSSAYITVGRARQRDIRVRDPSVSRHHCTIARGADGSYLLADCGSRAGVFAREPGPDSRLRRVYQIRLVVGMHVRLGAVTLLVTDAQGRCPLLADRFSEFCRLAVAAYGSHRAAARNTGTPRHLLDRVVGFRREVSR